MSTALRESIVLTSVPAVIDGPLHGEYGFVHSWEVGSAMDGPGVRMVLWTTGCLMRCQYCHNPDTWHLKNGKQMTLSEVTNLITPYARFLQRVRGGLTISGGEPLVQSSFVTAIFRSCQALGLHTALDTNGYLGHRLSDDDLQAIDLVLLDIKSWDPALHQRVTGVEVAPVLQFARRLARLSRPAWIRFVVVPGLTDDPANVDGVAAFVSTLGNVERVELLPFHQMGRHKWAELGLDYKLSKTQPADDNLIQRVAQRFQAKGVTVSY